MGSMFSFDQYTNNTNIQSFLILLKSHTRRENCVSCVTLTTHCCVSHLFPLRQWRPGGRLAAFIHCRARRTARSGHQLGCRDAAAAKQY